VKHLQVRDIKTAAIKMITFIFLSPFHYFFRNKGRVSWVQYTLHSNAQNNKTMMILLLRWCCKFSSNINHYCNETML